ncbi:MAG TPA: hypothetical protein VFU56_02050 [Gaiellaceae bacterium]|nr:hypothetical protein [Gaiellaceae bacterium]
METTRNIRLAAAGAVVALAAAGAAFGAAKLKGDGTHTGSAGPPGSFVSSGSGSSGSSGSSSVPRPWHRFGGPGGPGGPFSDHDGGLASAATYLGISRSDLLTQLRSGKTLAQVAAATSGKSAAGLVDALVADAKAQLAQAVTDGRLTQAQADRIEQDLKQRITDRVNRTGPGPGGPGDRHHGPGDALAAAATYLGSSQSDLMAQLRTGKTLGEIADATSGKSKAGLVAALVAQEKSELAQAVQDGRLTQAQADAMATDIEDRVTHLVDGDFPRRPDGPPPAPSPEGDPSA